jgi:protein-L-isoaspartate(D-aspartate) O-methyltransferase
LHPGSIPGEASNRLSNLPGSTSVANERSETMNPQTSSDPWAVRRQHMVDGQLRTSGVTDLDLLGVFADAPRERFVEPAFANLAYFDQDVPALNGAGRLLLAPMTLARLIQAAKLAPGVTVLDVAGGSGYGAAIMAHLGCKVTALETPEGGAGAKAALHKETSVECVVGDLAAGWKSRAPFEIIVINGAFEAWPEALAAQLKEGGRLVGVDASFPAPKAVLVERIGTAVSKRPLFDCAAPRLEPFRRAPEFAF